MRMEGLHRICDGTQVVCPPGATLFHLEEAMNRVGRATKCMHWMQRGQNAAPSVIRCDG